MADQNTAPGTGSGANDGTGTGSGTVPPSGEQTPNTENQNTGTDPAPTPKTYTEADMSALRKEAAASRVAAKKAEDRLKEIDDAQKTDQQKATEAADAATKRAEQAEARLNDLSRKQAITAAVSGIALYPDLIADRITAEDVPNDPATNAPDAKKLQEKIAALRGLYPGLFKPSDQGSDAGAGGRSPSGAGDMNKSIRDAFGRK